MTRPYHKPSTLLQYNSMIQHVLTVRQTENKESECSIAVHASLPAHARLRAINRPNLLNKQVICESVNTEILKRPNIATWRYMV